jgi:hypothetical protein
MWMRADKPTAFAAATVPDWVKDWLSRKRGKSTAASKVEDEEQQPKSKPSIRLTEIPEAAAKADPKAEQRAAAARERNKLEREAAVLAGLEDLDTWLSDQVQHGMASFVAQAAQACRTIAQRLVDAKASGLAGRLDGLPTRLFTLPEPARPTAAVRELGQVHLISEAYRRASVLPELLAADARQAVGWQVTREALLSDSEALRVDAKWRVFAVLSEAQPDRLRRVETWLWNEPAMRPLGECLPTTEMFRRLARTMGLETQALYDSDQDIARQVLNSGHPSLAGITLEELKARGWMRLNYPDPFVPFAISFPTASGKVEFVSDQMAKSGLNPVAGYTPSREVSQKDTALACEYPLALITPANHFFLNSIFANVARQQQRSGPATLVIRPDDAASRQIATGDEVRVANARGSFLATAEVSDCVRPGVVASTKGRWPGFSKEGATINATVDAGDSDMGGGALYHDNRVRVERTL